MNQHAARVFAIRMTQETVRTDMSEDIYPDEMNQGVYFGLFSQLAVPHLLATLTSLRIFEVGPQAELGPSNGVRSSSCTKCRGVMLPLMSIKPSS